MRILIGVEEIANIGNTYTQAFRSLGHDASCIVWHRKLFYKDAIYDRVIFETDIHSKKHFLGPIYRWFPYKIEATQEFLRRLGETDVFIYLFASSYLPYLLDYPILKLAGKKLVSVFCGDDIRYGNAVLHYAKARGYLDEISPYLETRSRELEDLFLKKLYRVRFSERWSDLIISSPEMGQLQKKGYMRLHIPLVLENYSFKVHGRAIPKIIHAPSNRGVKGTDVIVQAVEELKEEGMKFEFSLLENVPNEKVKEKLTESDIVVSQLYGDVFSTFSEEGMATGNAVIGRFVPDSVPGDPPAINATRFTVKDRIREMIVDIEGRIQLSYAARAYAEKYFDHLIVAQQMLNSIGGKRIAYDYKPDFYMTLRKHYLQYIRQDFTQIIRRRSTNRG